MELTQLCPADSAKIELIHPVTRQPLGASITVYGHDSAAFRAASKERARQALSKKPDAAQEDPDLQAVQLLAKCTVTWEGLEENGKALAFSHDAAVDLYTRYNWIREQIDYAIADRSRFFPQA